MGWPALNDYHEAIQWPQHCFCDPDLKNGAVTVTPFGMPKVASGNFASVYRINGNGAWAVRCFVRPTTDQESRYQVVGPYIELQNRTYFAKCQYLPSGIRVNGQWYPILKMEWAEGEPLSLYVQRNLHESAALVDLAGAISRIVAQLQRARIAHGDLQHGNILVDSTGSIRLVDYDGMFVPAFRGERSPELGHPNFQHPKRTPDHYDEHLDTFSALVIYTSLKALAKEPSLWDRFSNGENLIFASSDFKSPAQSELLQHLRRCPDGEVRSLAALLEACCQREPTRVRGFGKLILKLKPVPPPPREASVSAGRSSTALGWSRIENASSAADEQETATESGLTRRRRGGTGRFASMAVAAALIIGVFVAWSIRRSEAPQPSAAIIESVQTAKPAVPVAPPVVTKLDLQVESIRLFDNPVPLPPPPKGRRSYATEFQQGSVRALYGELNLKHPVIKGREPLTAVVSVYDPDGRLSKQQVNSYIGPGSPWTSRTLIIPHEGWRPGPYRVEISLNGAKVGATVFQIVAKKNETKPIVEVAKAPVNPAPRNANAEPAASPIVASFDCGSATTPSQRAICGDRDLASLDVTMTRQYSEALNRLPESQKRNFARDHSAWFRQFSDGCNGLAASGRAEVGNCVRNYLSARISELRNLALRPQTSEAAPQQVPPPVPAHSRTGEESRSDLRKPGSDKIGGQVREPVLLRKVEPVYPQLARQARVRGVVRIAATVGVNGKLRNITALSGSPLLVPAAMDAVRRWAYRPATLNGEAIEASIRIELHFALGR